MTKGKSKKGVRGRPWQLVICKALGQFLLGVFPLTPRSFIALTELCVIHMPSILHDLRIGLTLLNKRVKLLFYPFFLLTPLSIYTNHLEICSFSFPERPLTSCAVGRQTLISDGKISWHIFIYALLN